jgi:crossover junction endodeoxyribonuclease RuvC
MEAYYGGRMNILAIDIGTQCGWALGTRDGKVRSGSASFSVKKQEVAGQRWLKFRAFLTETGKSAGEIHAVYFEQVMSHSRPGQSGTNITAAHVYGGFLAHLEYWCALNRLPLVGVHVATVKKHWTGNHAAKKEQMVETAIAKGFRPEDNNEADALAILSLARYMESGDYVAPVKKKKPSKPRKSASLFSAAA